MRAWLPVLLLLNAMPAAAQMEASAGSPPALALAALAMEASTALSTLQPAVRVEPAVPSFLAPNDTRAEDYRVEWLGDPVPGVSLEIEEGSLQWARVDEVLRLPRGRLLVRAKGVDGGTATVAGFVQVLARTPGEDVAPTPDPAATPEPESGAMPVPAATPEPRGGSDGSARMLIPLVSGEGNPIDIAVTRDGHDVKGRAVVRYAPREPAASRIYVDTTCSPYNVRAEAAKTLAADDQWVYIGCRATTARATTHRTNSLEIVVFWDNVGHTITVDGVPSDSGGDSIWNLRASSKPGALELAAGEHRLVLRYSLADFPRKGSLGVGIGPYFDTFEGTGNDDRETLEPLVTLYGSYAITPWSRIVLFNATPIRADTYSDTGFYLQKRTSEALDRRVVANVFLGGHFIGFTAEDPYDPEGKKQVFFRFSAPQGVEFMIRDVPHAGLNVIVGGLTNPGIGGTAYYNLWVRWGNPRIFVELNYLGWQERIENPKNEDESRKVELRSIGISVGFPLIKFL